jgi:hypothetical protein
MTPPAMMIMERPRLFPLDGERFALRRSLDDMVLELLADADDGTCLVCDGRTQAIVGGARCEDCGSELLMGAEAA